MLQQIKRIFYYRRMPYSFLKGAQLVHVWSPAETRLGRPLIASAHLAADQLGHIIMFFEPNGVGLKLTAGN